MKNWRLNIIFFLFLFGAAAIIWQLYSLQIKGGERYGVLALGQQVSFKKVSGIRGEVFLTEGIRIAQTEKKNIIYIFPEKIPSEFLDGELEILANILVEEKESLASALQKGNILKKEISDVDLEKIKTENLKGVYSDEVLGRFYPQKSLAAHVVGFVNDEGQGQYGIEGYYDGVLGGQEFFQQEGKSPFGYLTLFLDSKGEKPLEKGADIWLTLDYNIQYFAEKLLKEAKEKWDIDSGQIIVEDPITGKILALANFPSFDSNQYATQESFEVFLNSSIQKLFEPGSVFKPITMAGALEEGLITPETKYEDKGFVEVGGPPIYNYKRRVWGEQSMTDVLEESINTGAIFVQQELGKGLFLKYLEKFGLFEKTGIDLQAEGFSLNESLKGGYPRDFAVASFGQGIELTPIQLVRAFGSLANGGRLMKPYFVEKIVESNNKEIITYPQIQREVISETTAAKLTAMLVNVVEQGSGRRAKIEGYLIAGKTGTAQVPLKKGGYLEDETIQSFIGYFPAMNPKVLIFVKLDNPKGVKTSEYSAAPLFRELAKHVIGLWQIPPSY